MGIYIGLIIYIILIALLIFYKKPSNTKRIVFLTLAFSAMFFIMGFRTETVGTDTSLYCKIFELNFNFNLKSALLEGDFTFIYSLYNKIVSLISTNRNAIIVGNSFLICFLTALFIYKNSKNVIFPTLFFITFYHFFSSMNIARQYIAVLLVANAFYFLKNRQLFKYIILCLMATLVHNTAIVSFILIPFFFIKLSKRNIITYLSIFSISLLFFDKILIIFSSIFDHYDMYLNSHYLQQIGQNKKVIITFIYIIIAIITTGLLNSKKLSKEEKYELKLLYLINFIAIILGIFSLKIMLISRIEIYFSIFIIILIPKVFNLLKDRIMYYFLFTLIMFIPMFMQLKGNNGEVLPYDNWLINLLF